MTSWDGGAMATPNGGEYPCCEAVKRIEAVQGEPSTLLGGICPIHGVTRHFVPPLRKCQACGATTRSTSTLNLCLLCGDADGLRPKHFLTKD